MSRQFGGKVIIHMGFVTRTTNSATGKRYTLSTAQIRGTGIWQTAVARSGFSLLGLFRPAMIVGGAPSNAGRLLHDSVEALVREVDPQDWESAKVALLRDLLGQHADALKADDEKFLSELTDRLSGMPKH